MSRAENRHHRERVIKNRVRTMKVMWPYSCSVSGPEWVAKQARQKDNPFTRCSCEMCSNRRAERAENRRDRKEAKHKIKTEED